MLYKPTKQLYLEVYKGVHSFPKSNSLKTNIIERLELELNYYDIAVQHVRHCATGTLPSPHNASFFCNLSSCFAKSALIMALKWLVLISEKHPQHSSLLSQFQIFLT